MVLPLVFVEVVEETDKSIETKPSIRFISHLFVGAARQEKKKLSVSSFAIVLAASKVAQLVAFSLNFNWFTVRFSLHVFINKQRVKLLCLHSFYLYFISSEDGEI